MSINPDEDKQRLDPNVELHRTLQSLAQTDDERERYQSVVFAVERMRAYQFSAHLQTQRVASWLIDARPLGDQAQAFLDQMDVVAKSPANNSQSGDEASFRRSQDELSALFTHHRSMRDQADARRTMAVQDCHFLFVCWALVGHLAYTLAELTAFPRLRAIIVGHELHRKADLATGQFTVGRYTKARHHFEHFGQRLPGAADFRPHFLTGRGPLPHPGPSVTFMGHWRSDSGGWWVYQIDDNGTLTMGTESWDVSATALSHLDSFVSEVEAAIVQDAEDERDRRVAAKSGT